MPDPRDRDRHDDDRKHRGDHQNQRSGEIHTHVHHERHEHYGGETGDNAAVLEVLARIEQKLDALGDMSGLQQRVNDLTQQLRQSTTGLATDVTNTPKE